MTGAEAAVARAGPRVGDRPAPTIGAMPQDAREDPTMTRGEVQALVVERLSAILAIEPSRVTPRAHLTGDLHADSLDLVEAVQAIEDEVRRRGADINLSEGAVAEWKTVDDVVNGVLAAIAERGIQRPT